MVEAGELGAGAAEPCFALPAEVLRAVVVCVPAGGRAALRLATRQLAGVVTELEGELPEGRRRLAALSQVTHSEEQLAWALAIGAPRHALVCASAAAGGRSDVLSAARLAGCQWGPSVTAAAAGGGHLALLRWLHDEGCPWTAATCAAAAGGGHTQVGAPPLGSSRAAA